MFGMSLGEIGVIMVIVLVVMGPEKIPEAARFLGKMMREIRKASNLLRDAIALDDDPTAARPVALGQQVPAPVGSVAMRDPDPRLDVRMVAMRPVGALDVEPKAVDLALSAPPAAHREVYLHVPYDETI